MNPDKVTVKNNYAQLVVTIVLIIVLATVIGLYIYMGMMRAGLDNSSPEVVIEEIPPPTYMTNEKRLQIIDNLVKEAPATSATNTDEIIRQISSESVSNTSPEERQKISDALKQ